MIYQVILLESVYEELNEIAFYYEERKTDLSIEFLADWEASMSQLNKHPLIFQIKHKQLRSIQLNKFPFLVVFEIIEKRVVVYRVVHVKRNPKKVYKK